MIRIKKNYFGAIFLIVSASFTNADSALCQRRYQLENGLYKVITMKGGAINLIVKETGTEHLFSPAFTIMYSGNDPQLSSIYNKNVGLIVPSWNSLKKKRTAGFFDAADATIIKATKNILRDNRLEWQFPVEENFTLTAELILPSGKLEPVIKYHFKVAKPGWYSVGYTGAPETLIKEVQELWQPFVWQEKRFPYMSFLSTEDMCPLPAVLVKQGNSTIGVIADPSQIPYRFSTLKNARFGVMLRNEKGIAQPMIFSPVFGGVGSYLEANDTANFSFRLVIHHADLFETYKYIAKNIFGFRDYRENSSCSLNETLENMIDYAMNDTYSGWRPELKGADYATDVSGTVKNVSALHPLSLSIITDNEQIYSRRALPMIEYLMSREKYLYAHDTVVKHQSPSHYLKGPAANVSELAALYEISKKKSTVFEYYAKNLYGKSRVLNLDKVVKGATWQNSLALYRMTKNTHYLDSAQKGADDYIAKRINELQTDFSDVKIASGERFPTSWTPQWIDLLELFEETKNKKYLNAAEKGARLFINFIWMVPQIPQGNIDINKGDTVGKYAYQNRFNPTAKPMKAPEQKVPARRLSQIGLMPESTTTYEENRAIFLTHYAPYLLRLANFTGESYFHDIARSAVVGRYANYPGYSIMGEYTTVYSRPDYPLKPLNELTYNNIYYNHVWPQIALLMDYLVSDAVTRSKGKIDFPSHYAQGYAYLQSKVYGDKAGSFYGDKNVQLWMPSKMLRTDNIQANYIAGYGNGNLYIGLMNQSQDAIQVKVQLNPDMVPYSENKVYKARLWKNNQAIGATTMQHGEISVPLAADGITAFSIDGLSIIPQFQDKILQPGNPLPPQSYSEANTPLGIVKGMIIDMGPSLINSYIYLQATETELKEVRLHYMDKGKWKEILDTAYPYEFSVPLSGSEQEFRYWVEGVELNGNVLSAKEKNLVL